MKWSNLEGGFPFSCKVATHKLSVSATGRHHVQPRFAPDKSNNNDSGSEMALAKAQCAVTSKTTPKVLRCLSRLFVLPSAFHAFHSESEMVSHLVRIKVERLYGRAPLFGFWGSEGLRRVHHWTFRFRPFASRKSPITICITGKRKLPRKCKPTASSSLSDLGFWVYVLLLSDDETNSAV